MEGQGYKLDRNILAEDNESTIRMSNNGKDSCTSNSKHIAIKYFWVTDRIKNGNIVITHCPTKQMIADYFTKPLQGELFCMFRDVIMGWTHVSHVYTSYHATKEHVGNNGIHATEKEKRIFEHDNNEKENSKGILAAHKMTTHVKKKTYAEAVKKQNSEILRTQNEIATLVVPDESRKYETSGKQEVTTHESAGESAGSCNA